MFNQVKGLVYPITVVGFLCVMFYRFDKIKTVDTVLLQLDSICSPLKNNLPPQSCIRLEADTFSNEFYFRAQFLMAPILLDSISHCDTTVRFSRGRNPTVGVEAIRADTICAVRNSTLTATLLKKAN